MIRLTGKFWLTNCQRPGLALLELSKQVLHQVILRTLFQPESYCILPLQTTIFCKYTGMTCEQIEKLAADKNRVEEPATKYKAPHKAHKTQR